MTVEQLEYIVHARDHEIVVLKQRVDALNRSLDRGTGAAASASSRNLRQVGRQAGRVGLVVTAALVLMAGGALKAAAGFEQSLDIFNAVSEASVEQMAAVRKEAIALGADIKLPATSAKDAAQAMTELAKGGLDVDTVLKATRGTLMLSAAAGIENAEAAKIQVRALKAFSLEGAEAGRVADLLAGAANSSTAEITDIADGFQNAAAQASNLGVPIEDLTTALALMADKGIAGARAGISLKVMMTRFVPLTGKASDAMKELGIMTAEGNNRLFDQHGRFVGLAKASAIFRKAMKGQTTEQKIATLQTIFGQDAQRAATFVLLGGAKAWKRMKAEVTKEGEAAKNAAARNKGLKGAVDALSSGLETAAIIFGTLLLPAANAFLRGFVIPAVSWLSKHKTATMIVSAALLTLGLALLAFSLAVKIYTLVTSAATVATWAWIAALLVHPIFMIAVGLIALGVALVVAYKKSETFQRIVGAALDAVAVAGRFLMRVFEWFRDHAGQIWSIVRIAIYPTLLVLKVWFEAVKVAARLLAAGFEWFRDHAGSIWSAVKAVLGPVLAVIEGYFRFLWTVLGHVVGAFKWLGDVAGAKITALKDAARGPLEKLASFFQAVWGVIKDIKAGIQWVIDHIPGVGKASDKAREQLERRYPGSTGFGPSGSEVGAHHAANISPKLWDEIALAHAFGLVAPTSGGGYRPGDPGDHGRYPAHAIDASNSSGPTPQMQAFALATMGRPGIKDVIYGGLPFWQDNGRIVVGWAGNEGLRLSHLNHVHASVFDQGGWLMPGLTLALNKTGVPERVIGPGGDRPLQIYINVEGNVTSERKLVDVIHEALKRKDRHNSGSGLRA